MNFPGPILPDPKRPFGPGEARIAAAARGGDGGEYMPCLWVDFLDASLGNLKEVLAIEGRSGVRREVDRAYRLSARGIHGVQSVSGRKPEVLAVICDAMHVVDPRKGSIFLENFGCR